ncbi:MAG TPA: hypothetical protein VM733_04795 [Thermoanaerobaculia bacterium]|nr:hypothetical protein [Thermoanaerobaculia bacterium]
MAKMKSNAGATTLEPPPGEFGPITWIEFQALPADVRVRRAQRLAAKWMALKGKVDITLDIDESRGRNRR